jgi:hypothetical protein
LPVAVQLQWVKGDAKAEQSFLKINQQAAPIDKTELRLIEARKLPNALAARAIVRSGTGHKYWSRFPEPKQREIEELAHEINELLFTPALRTPIKTLDLPVAGRGYSSQTLPLVFEFVNLANDVRTDRDRSWMTMVQHPLSFSACRRILHEYQAPTIKSWAASAVYFYAHESVPAYGILGQTVLVKEMEAGRLFQEFTRVRQEFEAFLLKHKMLVNQTVIKFGSG